MAAVVVREPLVRAAPRSAAVFAAIGLPVNVDRLDIGPVRATIQTEGAKRTLVVETEIVNRHGETQAAPLLRLTVRDAAGDALYSWTTNAGVKIVPGGSRALVKARLASPPAGADVVVEFARNG